VQSGLDDGDDVVTISSRQVRAELLVLGYDQREVREIHVRRVLRILLRLIRGQ